MLNIFYATWFVFMLGYKVVNGKKAGMRENREIYMCIMQDGLQLYQDACVSLFTIIYIYI